MADDIEKRIRCLEQNVADLLVRMMLTEEKLFDSRDRIRELEGEQIIALRAFYRTHPELEQELSKIDTLLGLGPDKKKPEN